MSVGGVERSEEAVGAWELTPLACRCRFEADQDVRPGRSRRDVEPRVQRSDLRDLPETEHKHPSECPGRDLGIVAPSSFHTNRSLL